MDGMTRRSFLRAGAWSAPAVTLAIAAPGAAASPAPVLGLSWEPGTANFVPLDFGAQVWSYLRVTNLSNETTRTAVLIQVLPPGPAYELNYNEGELITLSSAPVTLTTGAALAPGQSLMSEIGFFVYGKEEGDVVATASVDGIAPATASLNVNWPF